jgi:ribosomal protein L21E
MDWTHGLAAIASVANIQIGQHQQQQHPHPQYDDSPGDVYGNKRKAIDDSQSASSKSRRSKNISLAW